MWFLLSLLTAASVSGADALGKKALQTHTATAVAVIRPGWATLILLVCLPWAQSPTDPLLFWRPVLIALPLEVAAALLFNKALQIAPLSAVIPYMAFTPVFLMALGWVFLGETLSLPGVAGLLLVSVGALVLQIPLLEAGRRGWRRLIPHEKAPVMMLIVSFLFAVTSVLAKKALDVSSPVTFCLIYFPLITLGLLPFQGFTRDKLIALINKPKLFFAMGVLDAIALLVQFVAFQMTATAYVIAIKRLSILLSVAWGWIFFGEQKSGTRMAGALLMAAGAAAIALR